MDVIKNILGKNLRKDKYSKNKVSVIPGVIDVTIYNPKLDEIAQKFFGKLNYNNLSNEEQKKAREILIKGVKVKDPSGHDTRAPYNHPWVKEQNVKVV